MCARFKFNGQLASPGQKIPVRSEAKHGEGKWDGFARSETLVETWLQKGWVEVDIPASDFAERNRLMQNTLTWGQVDDGHVVSGIGNRDNGKVKVVTREATPKEHAVFGHNRLPVIIPTRF